MMFLLLVTHVFCYLLQRYIKITYKQTIHYYFLIYRIPICFTQWKIKREYSCYIVEK
jgi:hypothetical protein